MQQVSLFALMCVAMCAAYPYPIAESEDGSQYYLVPVEHHRIRRQTSVGIDNKGFGLSHTGNIVDNNKHRLAGTAFGRKHFGGPVTLGGNLDYSHKPTGSVLSVGAANTRGYGTDVTAQGKYNFFQSRDGRTTADLSGQYSRHFGGPQGTGRPDYGAFVHFNHRF